MISQVPPIHPSWRRNVTTDIFFSQKKRMFLDDLILTRNYRLIEQMECHPGFFSRPSETWSSFSITRFSSSCCSVKIFLPGEGARRTVGHHLWDFCSSIQAGSLDWQLFLYQDRNPLYQFNKADAFHARWLEGKKKDGKGWEAGSVGRQSTYCASVMTQLHPQPQHRGRDPGLGCSPVTPGRLSQVVPRADWLVRLISELRISVRDSASKNK